ncbi:aat family amino acid transporter [Fusarium langsethiae]|uniref:Aat family amino acid transporter n=1 Tax=Fusarium langsethiae TaxID=179993 RepID=A0A0M9ESQ8_FUSLA|nr:aat family amino acid transporter [Fusarium langsethiae]
MGWNYCLQWLFVLPLEIIAGAFTIGYWNEAISRSVFVSIFLLTIVVINLFGVKTYGEAEFIFSLIKITAIVGFILLAIVINIGGEPEGQYIGGMYWRNPGAFKNGFKGFCSVLVTSAFSFTGTELIGLAAAETANPRKSLPTAIKQVFWRIMIFYLVALLLVGLLVPSDDKRLVGGDNVADATASPFVIAIEKAGTSLLPGIMNAIILIAVISVGNSAVFGSSRTLAALAEQSHAPQIFAYVDRQGRPLMAILFASCIGFLAFLADVNSHDAIFNWLLSISALSTLFTWGSICLCYIRFRAAWSYNAHTIEQLPFKSHVGVVGAWVALIGYILVLVSQVWIAASPVYAPDIDDGPSGAAQNFFLKVLAIPIILLFYICHKVWYRTRVARLEEMDVETGRRYFRVQEREERLGWPKWKRLYWFLSECMDDVHLKVMEASYTTIIWAAAFAAASFFSYRIIAIALRSNSSQFSGLPRPKDHQAFVGHALRILRGAGPNNLYLQWMRRWPDAPFIRCLSWLNEEILLVNSLEACREVLQTNAYSLAKPGFFHTLVGEFLGVGLLFSVGEQHKRLRRIIAVPLSRPSIRKLFPTFVSYSHKLNREVQDSLERSQDETVELEELITRVTLDIIGVSLLGRELRDFSSPSSPLSFEQCYNAILAQPLAGQIISFINPFIPLRWLPVSANLDFIRAKSALKTMMEGLIEQRTTEVAAAKRHKGGSSLSDDLLTKMIEASAGESQELSKGELIDITMQVIAAGHETTASALVWTAYALSRDLASQKRLRAEIHSLGTGMSDKGVDELPFLENVIREAMRVYSPTLIIPWEAQRDMTITGVDIPKGTTVQIVPATIQLNPQVWGSDADIFRPERWEDMDSNASSPYAMETFSNGPRMCPGKALAMLNMKVLLVGLIRDFEMELEDDERKVELRNPSLTLKTKKPIRFKIRRVG